MAEDPKSMKAAVLTKFSQPLELKSIPVPELKEGQVLVKIVASGVCHTDAHVVNNEWPDLVVPLPFVVGHEGAGYVVKLGPNVKSVRIGDRVGAYTLWHSCGHCRNCRDGWNMVCPEVQMTGLNVYGGYAEYVVAWADYVARIPDELDFYQAAPIMCAGVTSYKALKTSKVRPGQWVVITGAAGGLGHVALQYAKAMGMRVIAVTRSLSPDKKKMFEEYGIDYTVDMSKEVLKDGVMKATEGLGAEGVICITPRLDDVTDAIEYVRRRGTIVTVGLDEKSFDVNPMSIVMKSVTIVGSPCGNPSDLTEALKFAAAGKVKCHVTKRKLEEVNDVLDGFKKGTVQGRVVLEVSSP